MASGSKALPRAIAALLALVIVLAYSNTFDSPFTFDDNILILDNPTIKTLWPLGTFQGVVSKYPYLNQIIYVRPVSNFLFALNYAVSGTAPWSYHLVNLALHICSVMILFAILCRTLRTPLLVERFGDAALGLAAGGALLWGLHPLLTNAVTYISPRMEMTMALFYLLTLYAWIRGVQGRSRLWLGLSVAACVLGMMSKEVMVTAPFIVLLYDGLFLANSWREALRRRWPWYLGLLLSMVWLLFLIEQVPGSGGLLGNPTAPSANERGAFSDRWSYAATMPGVILYYLRLLAWPDPLIFDYKWPAAESLSAILLPGSAIAAAAAAATWGLFRRQPWAYPIAWYLVTLSPSSSLMPLYDDYIAEYRAYLPSIGPLALVPLLAWQGLAKTGWTLPRRIKTGLVTGALVLLALGSLTYARNGDYRTQVALWSDTVRKAPHNERAHLSLGTALATAGQPDEAIAQYREALRLNPRNNRAYSALGVTLHNYGIRQEEVEPALREALRLDPNFIEAYHNLGKVLLARGRKEEAAKELRAALRLDPALAEAHFDLGTLLVQLNDLAEAEKEMREALRLDPALANAHNNLGFILVVQGRRNEAEREFREALRLKPDFPDAEKNLKEVLRSLATSPEQRR